MRSCQPLSPPGALDAPAQLLRPLRVEPRPPGALQPGLQRRDVRHKATPAKQCAARILPGMGGGGDATNCWVVCVKKSM